MKKILTLLAILMLVPFTNTFAKKPEGSICPEVKNLVVTTKKDKSELTEALKVIIPMVYGTDPKQQEWRIETINFMPQLTGFELNHYNMAANFCGENVASYSWYVRFRFQLLTENGSLGELYIVKDKNLGWVPWKIWFQHHQLPTDNT